MGKNYNKLKNTLRNLNLHTVSYQRVKYPSLPEAVIFPYICNLKINKIRIKNSKEKKIARKVNKDV